MTSAYWHSFCNENVRENAARSVTPSTTLEFHLYFLRVRGANNERDYHYIPYCLVSIQEKKYKSLLSSFSLMMLHYFPACDRSLYIDLYAQAKGMSYRCGKEGS